MPTVIAGDFNVAKKKAPKRGVKINRKKKITVAVLAKKVAELGKVSYDKVITGSTYANSENLTASYNTWNVSRIYNNCSPIFGNVAADLAEVQKAMLTRKEIFVSIRQNSEPNLVRMTLFLVSLKDQGATTTLFDPATRQLVLTSAGGADIAAIDKPECCRLNPKSFTVHATRRFTMGYEGSAGPTSDTYSQKRFRFIVKPKQQLIQNPTGNIFANSSFSSPTDPSQNYFIILVNDNSIVDLEYPKADVIVYDHWSIPS